MMTKFFRIRSVAAPFIMCSLMASTAVAQSYPVSNEESLLDVGSWQPIEEGVGGFVRSDTDGGWTQLSVERFSSMGIALDSLEFTVSYGVYEPIRNQFSRLIDKSIKNKVRLVVDSQTFTAASASYGFDDNGLIISMSFTPMEDDDGVLDQDEPNCQVVSALRNGYRISVIFPDNSGNLVEGLTLSGKGSSAALGNLC